VSNLDAPQLLQRVSFGSLGVGEDYEILNYELPEDQDNIQKAFRVFPDGLVAVPFSTVGTDGTTACGSDAASGIQLMSLGSNTLTKHAVLPMPGNPKRAIELSQGELLGVSDSDVRAFSLANLDMSMQTADVSIGTCVMPTIPSQTGGPGGFGDGIGGPIDDFPQGNDTPSNGAAPTPSTSWWWSNCP
jgi:hypothetical protein